MARSALQTLSKTDMHRVSLYPQVMTVDEWAARWKKNEDFPECLACGSKQTKEHYFVQTWCRHRKFSLCQLKKASGKQHHDLFRHLSDASVQ
eukprot:scaffold283949_cov15-Tisochrysis_lutea.AAC.1